MSSNEEERSTALKPSLSQLLDVELDHILRYTSMWDLLALDVTNLRFHGLVSEHMGSMSSVEISIPINSLSDTEQISQGLKRTVFTRFSAKLQVINSNQETALLLLENEDDAKKLALNFPNLIKFPLNDSRAIEAYVTNTFDSRTQQWTKSRLREVFLCHNDPSRDQRLSLERNQDILNACPQLDSLILDCVYLGIDAILDNYFNELDRFGTLQKLTKLRIVVNDLSPFFISWLQELIDKLPLLSEITLDWSQSKGILHMNEAIQLTNLFNRKGRKLTKYLIYGTLPESDEVMELVVGDITDFIARLYMYQDMNLSVLPMIESMAKLQTIEVEVMKHSDFIVALINRLPITVTEVKLRRLEYENCVADVILFLCRHGNQIEKLHLEIDADVRDETAIGSLIATISECCPKISQLILWSHDVSCTDSIRDLIAVHGHQLTMLELFGVKSAVDIIDDLAASCKKLTCLEVELYQPEDMVGMATLRDKLQLMNRLHEATIRVSGIKQLTGEHVEHIVSLPNIRYLNGRLVKEE
ncbi:hypothetical protein HDE_07885 [Halotydeus destructor]|nr:hypothetical protein HDE_07885 [Halotydeus destructor]